MPSIVRHSRRRAAALALALACGGALVGGMAAAGEGRSPASCELRVARDDGAVTLTALARAEAKVDGRYTFRVSGAGTDIRQGGPFGAAPGRPATLGTVTLGATGAGYDAELALVVGGQTLSCAKRIAGGL